MDEATANDVMTEQGEATGQFGQGDTGYDVIEGRSLIEFELQIEEEDSANQYTDNQYRDVIEDRDVTVNQEDQPYFDMVKMEELLASMAPCTITSISSTVVLIDYEEDLETDAADGLMGMAARAIKPVELDVKKEGPEDIGSTLAQLDDLGSKLDGETAVKEEELEKKRAESMKLGAKIKKAKEDTGKQEEYMKSLEELNGRLTTCKHNNAEALKAFLPKRLEDLKKEMVQLDVKCDADFEQYRTDIYTFIDGTLLIKKKNVESRVRCAYDPAKPAKLDEEGEELRKIIAELEAFGLAHEQGVAINEMSAELAVVMGSDIRENEMWRALVKTLDKSLEIEE